MHQIGHTLTVLSWIKRVPAESDGRMAQKGLNQGGAMCQASEPQGHSERRAHEGHAKCPKIANVRRTDLSDTALLTLRLPWLLTALLCYIGAVQRGPPLSNLLQHRVSGEQFRRAPLMQMERVTQLLRTPRCALAHMKPPTNRWPGWQAESFGFSHSPVPH